MRLVGIWLRNVGNGVTPVCELAAFDLGGPFWFLLGLIPGWVAGAELGGVS
jgi:hypothetical protein